MSNTAIVCVLFCVACATGGQSDGGDRLDGSVGLPDASGVVMPDARVRLDGGTTPPPPPPDAAVSQTPDAGTQGPFCSSNSQCTTAGQCCVTLSGPMGFCAPGTVVLGQCVPQ